MSPWFNHLSWLAACHGSWPTTCFICHQRATGGVDLCQHCLRQLPTMTMRTLEPVNEPVANTAFNTLCVQCGKRWPIRKTLLTCLACASKTSPFAQIVVPYRFAWPMDQLVHRLKYRGQRPIGRVLGMLLAQEVRASRASLPELILPVPVHAARLRQRGFNHASDIATSCAAELGLRSYARWASRIVDTGALAGLSRAERELCIRGAFTVSEQVAGKRVALVDDVLTSGATARELARELYDTGAEEVSLWAVARTELGD